MPPTEGLVVIATGATLWGFAVVTPRPAWAPDWTGWLLTIIGIALIVRGVVGIAGAMGAFAGRLRSPRGWPGNRAPRTEEETVEALAKRPPGWEYLYFAGNLITARAALEGTYLDHELRYVTPSGDRIQDDDAVDYLQQALDDVRTHLASLAALMESDVQERAFGPAGQPGDPDRIRHLAERWTSVYGDLIGWAARIRAARTSATYRGMFEAVAHLIDQPIQQYRDFVDAFVREVDRIPRALRLHESLEINPELTLSIDQAASEAVDRELARAQAISEGGFDQI
jgi:hypothetical protein